MRTADTFSAVEADGNTADTFPAVEAAEGMPDEPAAGAPEVPVVDAGADSPIPPSKRGTFEVHLSNFDGPFDLLLNLIAKHKLDVTEVALSQVTDEFIAYITAAEWDLGQATEFLIVAATLLDLKAARLLPAAEVDDEEDLALLEARDLLFARLLQYRAYKLVAATLGEWARAAARRFPRAVGLEPRFAEALPEVLLGVGPEQFARLAAKAMRPKAPAVVEVMHLHNVQVSVREQAQVLRAKLVHARSGTFRGLVADCEHTTEVVARFLAVLELFREGVLAFEQVTPLGELMVRWTGPERLEENDPRDDAMDEEYG